MPTRKRIAKHRQWARLPHAGLLLLAITLPGGALASWWHWWRTEPLRLEAALAPGETYAQGTSVFVDDDVVGIVEARREVAQQQQKADLELNLTRQQRDKARAGLVRLAGTRAVWLTSEFEEAGSPPLVDGDSVPFISQDQRRRLQVGKRLARWIFPAGGLGAVWLLRKLLKPSG